MLMIVLIKYQYGCIEIQSSQMYRADVNGQIDTGVIVIAGRYDCKDIEIDIDWLSIEG